MPTVWLCPSAFAPHVGGIEEATRQLGLEMQRRGVTVRVITHRYPADLPEDDVVDGLPVRRIAFPAPTATLRGAASAAAAVGPTVRALRAVPERPDAVHVHGVSLQTPALTAYCALTRTPLLVTTHGEVAADDHDVFAHSAYLRSGLRWASRRAVAVAAVSPAARDAAAAIAPAFADAAVIPGGVDPDAWSALPEVPAPVFAAWGRHEHVKGFDVLVRAFAELRSTQPHAQLLLGGDGSTTNALRDLAGDGVEFVGRLDRRGVAELLARARVVVVPSRTEAFGLVALEALAAGRTVVWSELPGLRAATGGLGVPVVPDDAGALCAAMLAALRVRADPAVLRAHARGLSWASAVDRYLALTPGLRSAAS